MFRWEIFSVMDSLNFETLKKQIFKKFQLNQYLAKSDKNYKTNTSIEDHVKDLLYELDNFLSKYSDVIKTTDDMLLLRLAILFHDIGKINILFQKKLTENKKDDVIPHNCLSPLFLKLVNKLEEDKLSLLTYIIFNHHKRGANYFSNDSYGINLLIKQIQENQKYFFNNFEFSEETLENYKVWLLNSLRNRKSKKYIILTGLLIRLDHAASGELEVEEEPIKDDRKDILFSYFKRKNKTTKLRPFQERYGINEKKDYQCIVADTGLGKTGLSVLWSHKKIFYILPNRASVNAMFNTLKEIYGEYNVGLLHSTALFNLIQDNEDDIAVLKEYDQTRVLSKPVTVCTADQLFTAAFNMPGYEKIYATLSYSDVIIDEIQGFQPQQIIPMLKQIKETKELGANYLIITATLPSIVTNRLMEYGFDVIENDDCTTDPIKRHKIKIEKGKTIEDLSEGIVDTAVSGKKVLVIVNTVKKAQEMYNKINNTTKEHRANFIDVNILHSRYIWKDRQVKENAIIDECEQDNNFNYKKQNYSIWITTQLVEASLDIDFDYLFSEASTADSVIQRMGRVWRHKNVDYNGDENIIIATAVENTVYEKILIEKTVEMIENSIKNNDNILISSEKRRIVNELYSEKNLKQWRSKYIEEWNKFEEQINSGWNFILEENSQRAFRDVMSIDLIPAIYKEIVESSYKKLLDLRNEKSLDGKVKRLQRLQILKEIQEYKVPVPLYLLNPNVSRKLINTSQPIEWIDKGYGIGILHEYYKYDQILGLTCKGIKVEDEIII